MRDDPIIAEVRKVREELAREAGLNLDRMFEQEAEEFRRRWAGRFQLMRPDELPRKPQHQAG